MLKPYKNIFTTLILPTIISLFAFAGSIMRRVFLCFDMARSASIVEFSLQSYCDYFLKRQVEVDRRRNYEFAQEQCLSALTHIAWVPRRGFSVHIAKINIFQIP